MATQNVTLDGTTQISAFGDFYDWNNSYIEDVYIRNAGSLTNDTLNITLTGAVWRMRRLEIEGEAPTARLNVSITDANDDIVRRIDWLQLGDYVDTTVSLINSRIKFIDGAFEGNLTLNLGSGRLDHASLYDTLTNTVTMGSGSVNFMGMGDGTNIVNGGSGWIGFLGMGQGTNTFLGGTGNFGTIRAFGTNTMTFSEGGDSIVFGSGNTLITLNNGWFGSISGYGESFSSSAIIVGATANVGTISTGDGTDSLTVNASLTETDPHAGGGVDFANLGGGTNTITINGAYINTVQTSNGDDILVLAEIEDESGSLSGSIAQANLGSGANSISIRGSLGSLTTYDGDDTLSLLFGEVVQANLGSGNNTVEVEFGFFGSLTTYEGDDTLDVFVATLDQVNLGGGNNVVTVDEGYIDGLTTNNDNDTLTLRGGEIEAANIGGGDNTVTVTNGWFGTLQMTWGNDQVTLTESEIDTVSLGGGTNRLTLSNSQVNSVLADGNETIALKGDSRILQLKMDSGVNVLTTETGNIESIYAYDAKNTITLGLGGAHQIVLSGSAEAQRIQSEGWVGSLQIYAGNLAAVQATTVILGGEGAGYIQTSKGDDRITTGSGEVLAIATFDGNDTVTVGSGGVAAVSTGIGNDVVNAINGRMGALATQEGNDTVNLGLGGADYVSLGEGDDLISITRFPWTMEVQGDEGVDTVSLFRFNADLWVSLNTSEKQNIGAPPGPGPGVFGFLSMIDVENLTGSTGSDTFTGSAAANVLNGFDGNDVLSGLGGNDTLLGLNGNDVLDGGLGDDSLNGGAGVDTVVFTGTTSVVLNLGKAGAQNTGYGLDTIVQVESAIGGLGNDVLRGNTLANALDGSNGHDVLNGDLGNDTLTGGVGNDAFLFNTTLGAGNVDTITDFNPVFDVIRIDDAVFAGMATGVLAASAFLSSAGGVATTAAHRIIYDNDSGDLFFDSNGSAAGGATRFAVLAPNLAVTEADFVVI